MTHIKMAQAVQRIGESYGSWAAGEGMSFNEGMLYARENMVDYIMGNWVESFMVGFNDQFDGFEMGE